MDRLARKITSQPISLGVVPFRHHAERTKVRSQTSLHSAPFYATDFPALSSAIIDVKVFLPSTLFSLRCIKWSRQVLALESSPTKTPKLGLIKRIPPLTLATAAVYLMFPHAKYVAQFFQQATHTCSSQRIRTRSSCPKRSGTFIARHYSSKIGAQNIDRSDLALGKSHVKCQD